MQKRWFVTSVATAVFLLAGCNEQATTTSKNTVQKQAIPVPVMDTSTPDRAVKSHWALKDYVLANSREVEQRFMETDQFKGIAQMFRQVNSPQIADDLASPTPAYQYSRDITQAKVETESRAVVFAVVKNVTPLPTDAVLSRSQTESREKGKTIKYVLEKDQSSWRITEIWQLGEYTGEYIKSYPTKATLPIYVFGGF